MLTTYNEVDMSAVERAARMAEMHDFILSEMPQGYNTELGEAGIRLSGGQRQRIGIARTLYHNPDVLVMDEATSALDNVTEKAIIRTLHETGTDKTIIMIAHRLTTVENCDIIFYLERGQVAAQGSYEVLKASSAGFRAMATAN